MKYKLVIADVDGTIIPPNGRPTVHAAPKLVSSVKAIRKVGVAFTLATARSLDWIEGLVKSLNLDSVLILDNGARLFDLSKRKYIFDAKIPPRKGEEILKFLFSRKIKPFYVNNSQRYQFEGGRMNLDALTKIMVLHLPTIQANTLYKDVNNNFQDVSITKSISGANPTVISLHFTNKKASKDKAVGKISRYLKIRKEEIIGIGDSFNDIEFLNRCGLKIAMGNALAEVKKIADYIAPPYYEDGVSNVLKKFILDKVNE